MEYFENLSIVRSLDKKDIKKLIKIKTKDKNKEKDIVFELYNRKLLTSERLNFIVQECTDYLPISSSLLKELMKNNKLELLDIIFQNYIFFENEFIILMLLHYKYKRPISSSDLKKEISKYKLSFYGNNYAFNTTSSFLINPCQKGHLDILKYLYRHGADINGERYSKWVPLHVAIENGHENIVRYLLEHGVDINIINMYGKTPLYLACKKGYGTIVENLIEYGADVNESNLVSFDTPLRIACEKNHEMIVKILVEHGAKVNICDDEGNTLLHYACRNGNEAITKILIEHGAEVNKENNSGWTPLLIACEEGYEMIVNLLINFVNNNGFILDINKKYKGGISPLLVALNINNINIVKLLIDYVNDHKIILNINKFILIPVKNNNFDMFKLLIK